MPAGTMMGYDEAAAMQVRVQRQPVARFWLLAALFAIGTGLTGWWTLADRSSVWNVQGLWEQVIEPAKDHNLRRIAHGIATGAIVLLLLMLALVSRLAVGRRVVITAFSMLLIAFLALQLWFGSLLMFDSYAGKLERFNGSGPTTLPASASEPAPSTAPSAPSTAPISSR
jgi:hypothetical protein